MHMSDVADRLERLPFCNVHPRLLFMGGLGYTFDAMDGAIMAFVLPVVSALWGLSSVQTGVLGSATFIGFFFGAICAGTPGDLLGTPGRAELALQSRCPGSSIP
jgi:putative MFS transporter